MQSVPPPPPRDFAGPRGADLSEQDEVYFAFGEARPRPRPATEAGADEIPFQAVEPPSVFAGRESDIALLEEKLRSRQKVVVIRGGLGGIGKTALAATIAHRMRADFPDGILWGRMDVTDSQSALISFISSFGRRGAARLRHLLSDDARAGYYRDLLSTKRCLIVLDNVERARQVTDLLPSASRSKVLITTRYALGIEGAYEHMLTTISSEAATRLLEELLGPAVRAAGLDELAAELGRLPLAICIAAGIMRDLGWTAADYLGRFRESTTLDWLGDDSDSASVRKSFAISYQELPGETVRRAFRTLGAVEQQSVSGDLISHMVGSPASQTGLLVLALVRRGLVEVEPHGPTHVLLHPLVRRYAYELLVEAGEEPATHAAAGQWYREGLEAWDAGRRQFDYTVLGSASDIARGLEGARHYQRAGLYEQAQELLVAVADIATLHGRAGALLELLDELARVTELVPWLQIYRAGSLLTTRDEGRVAEGERLLENLTRAEDLKIASAAFITLARARFLTRRYAEAEQFLHRSRALKEQLTPRDLKGLAFIENELAHISLHNGGKYSDALESHRRALELQRSTSDMKGMAYTLRRIATIRLRHFDQPEEALKTLDEGERLAVKTAANLILVLILSEKADALRRLKYFADAVAKLEAALEVARQCDDPLPEAHVLRRLGLVYENVEYYGRAYDCLQRCRTILTAVNPEAAAEVDSSLKRVEAVIGDLKSELAQVGGLIAEAAARGDKAAGRILRRRAKRIRQRLNLEPAQIRLGHRGAYTAAGGG